MTRIDFDQLADDFLDGTLSGSEWQRLLDEHGEILQDTVKRAEAMRDALRSLPRSQLPAGVRAGIGVAIAAPPAAARKPLHWTWRLGAPLAAAAALIIAVMTTQQEQERALKRAAQETPAEPRALQEKVADGRNAAPIPPAATAPAKPSAEREEMKNRLAATSDDKETGQKGAAVGMARGSADFSPRQMADADALGAEKNEFAAKLSAPTAPAAPAAVAVPADWNKQLEETDLTVLEQEARKFNKDGAGAAMQAMSAPAPGPLALSLALAPVAVDQADEVSKSKLRLDAQEPVVEINLSNRTVGDVTVPANELMLRGLDALGKPIWSIPVTDQAVIVPAQQQVRLQKSLADTPPPKAVTALVVVVGSSRSESLALPGGDK
jgi:hypothetical protein